MEVFAGLRPLIVASEMGGYLQSVVKVRLENSGTWPHQRASSKVERAGLKRAACANAMRSAEVVLPRAALAWKAGEGCQTSSSQSFAAGVC